jgi:phage N-6-adenine-methyltransferase
MSCSTFTNSHGTAFSSKRMDWETPPSLFKSLDQEFHFTLDAAASEETAKCPRYYTLKDDGLAQDWGGETVFCNPPYGRQLAKWVEKASVESRKPGTTVVLLIPARTDTRWFHGFIHRQAEVRFLKGRIHFLVDGIQGNAAPFPSMVVVMGGSNV